MSPDAPRIKRFAAVITDAEEVNTTTPLQDAYPLVDEPEGIPVGVGVVVVVVLAGQTFGLVVVDFAGQTFGN
jgi:hypothetical protein